MREGYGAVSSLRERSREAGGGSPEGATRARAQGVVAGVPAAREGNTWWRRSAHLRIHSSISSTIFVNMVKRVCARVCGVSPLACRGGRCAGPAVLYATRAANSSAPLCPALLGPSVKNHRGHPLE